MKRHIILATLLFANTSSYAYDFLLTRSQRAQKLVEEGQRQILQGDYLRAIDSCTQALGFRVDWSPAYVCRSEAKLHANDIEAASQDARKAGHLDPKSGEPFRILGILEFQAGRYPQAIERFSQALKLSKLRPEDVSDIYYYRASSFLKLEQFERALKDVEEGLGVLRGINGDYGDWGFYSLRAEIRRQQGDQDRADGDERKVVSLISERARTHPAERPALLHQLSESHMLLRDYPAAIKDLDAFLGGNGQDPKVLLDRANVYSLSGRHKEAVADLDRVLRVDPSDIPALRLRSMERFTLGDTAGALSDLDAALAVKPNDEAALTARGILKRYLSDYRGSLKDLNAAQTIDPADPGIWGHKAFVLEMLEEHKAAMSLAQKTLKVDPSNTSAHVALALSATAVERCDAALPSLDQLIQQAPDSGHYYWLRGECRCKSDQYRGCLEDIKTAQSLDPGSAFLALRLAQIDRQYLDRSKTPVQNRVPVQELRDCLSYFDRAASLKPLDLESRLERARTMIELGKRLEDRSFLYRAARECRKILKQYPKNRTARSLLESAR